MIEYEEIKHNISLKKEKGIIFDYELCDAIGMTKNWIMILDKDSDNVITIDEDENVEKHTISKEDINNIKECISRFDILFTDVKIPRTPILDGTIDKIDIINRDKSNEIRTNNLWYWYFEKKVVETDASEEEKVYTQSVIDLLDDIAEILQKYDLTIQLEYDEE